LTQWLLDRYLDIEEYVTTFNDVRKYRAKAGAYSKTATEADIANMTDDDLNALENRYHQQWSREIFFDKNKAAYVIIDRIRYNLNNKRIMERIIDVKCDLHGKCGPSFDAIPDPTEPTSKELFLTGWQTANSKDSEFI
jgi:hypothetical protein